LGVMSSGIAPLGWDRALAYCRQLGLDAIEFPIGANARSPLLQAAALLDNPSAQQKLKDDLARHNLVISALSASGNPVHPDPAEAQRHERAHDIAVRLASQLGVGTVIAFSGCPGGAPGDKTPNWVTCPWPTEYSRILEYQWNEVLVPFWSRKAVEA